MFCGLFEMDNNYQQAGDLTDVVIRATSAAGLSSDFSLDSSSGDRRLWPHFPADECPTSFGDPVLFSTATARDPFLHPHFSAFNFASDGGGGAGGVFATADRPCNIFSRMLQISPSSKMGDGVITSTPPSESATAVIRSSTSSTLTKASACRGGAVVPSSGSNPLCLTDNSGMQISPPRNPTLKRRKSQVKKVVCIPAPAPANSRSSSGEVVPSDLWAWRKYGQKPIKGSPYPRGYYRCSSSKGCSARKQVERSRTDPNMLVITYTSEHNHPWPTQRNALAGSTRSHSSRKPCLPKHENGNLAETTAGVKEEAEMDEEDRATTGKTENDHPEEGDHQEFPYDLLFSEFADQINEDDHHLPHHTANPLNNNPVLLSSHGFERSKDPFLELYDWPQNSNGSFFKEAKGG